MGPSATDQVVQQAYTRQLDAQFAELPAAWEKLQQEGVTPETQLELGFSYAAPTEAVARDLSEMLQRKHGYEVEVEKQKKTELWLVLGKTVETSLTLDILQRWLAYMVQAGAERGCLFGGWRALRGST